MVRQQGEIFDIYRFSKCQIEISVCTSRNVELQTFQLVKQQFECVKTTFPNMVIANENLSSKVDIENMFPLLRGPMSCLDSFPSPPNCDRIGNGIVA